jgi:hypothetical protein
MADPCHFAILRVAATILKDDRAKLFGFSGRIILPVLVVLNKKVTTFGKKSNLKLGLIQTRQLH